MPVHKSGPLPRNQIYAAVTIWIITQPHEIAIQAEKTPFLTYIQRMSARSAS